MALEGLVPLWAVSHFSHGRIERLAVWMNQTDASGNEEKRIDTQAQNAASELEGLPYKRGPLAE
jgi:hypothetical protein